MRKYFCPKCKGETFEEVLADVTVTYRIVNTSDGPEYDEQKSCEGGYVAQIQCESCGHIIRDAKGNPVTTMDDLAPGLEAIGAFRDEYE